MPKYFVIINLKNKNKKSRNIKWKNEIKCINTIKKWKFNKMHQTIKKENAKNASNNKKKSENGIKNITFHPNSYQPFFEFL